MHRLSNRFYVLFCWCICILPFAVPHCARGFQFGKELSGIPGRAYDEQTQQILSRVEVTLRGAGGMMQAQVVTNESGRFNFGNLARGDYQIEARMNGYQPYSAAVNVGGGESQGMTIYLKHVPLSQEPSSGSTVSAHELSMPTKACDLMYSGKQKVFYGKNLDGGLDDIDAYLKIDPNDPAGAHAKEMRAEVIQKIRDEKVVSENGAPK
jgi:hypothetical protein